MHHCAAEGDRPALDPRGALDGVVCDGKSLRVEYAATEPWRARVDDTGLRIGGDSRLPLLHTRWHGVELEPEFREIGRARGKIVPDFSVVRGDLQDRRTPAINNARRHIKDRLAPEQLTEGGV